MVRNVESLRLLTGVPNRQLQSLVVKGYHFHLQVNANGRMRIFRKLVLRKA